MRRRLTGAAIGLCVGWLVAAPVLGDDVVEPRSGVKFAAKDGDMTLLGVGLRTKTFLKVKVYAAGFYVSDGALHESLASHRGATSAPGFFKDLVWGDFGKEIVLKFVRDVTTKQIQDAFKEALPAADKAHLDAFAAYFGDTKEGQQYRLRWAPGGSLETTVAGQAKVPIADKDFAAAVFGIWLGEKPIQEDLKAALVSRAPDLLK
jgi:hypothetical protein